MMTKLLYIETSYKQPGILQPCSGHIRGLVSYKDMAKSDLAVEGNCSFWYDVF